MHHRKNQPKQIRDTDERSPLRFPSKTVADAVAAQRSAPRGYTRWSDVPEGLRSATHWRKQGRRLKPDAAPAGIMAGMYRNRYCLYDESETVERSPVIRHPACPIDLLRALFALTRSAKRYRNAAQAHYSNDAHGFAGHCKARKEQLYSLKDRGLVHAVQLGRIAPMKVRGSLTEYRGEGYCFHSFLRPADMGPTLVDDDDSELIVAAKKREADEPRLKDAIATIEVLPELDLTSAGFVRMEA